MSIETPYEIGFFAGVAAQEINRYTIEMMMFKNPYPEKDNWGGTSYYNLARKEFMRGWADSKDK